MKKLLAALLLTLSAPLLACPFCNPGESDVFSDLASSQAAVLVEKVDTRKYKVVETLRGSVRKGRVVVAAEPQGTLGKKGTMLLTTAGPGNLPYWSDAPRVLDAEELDFARKSLNLVDSTDEKQWDFAAHHLQHRSRVISSAAYNMLASAPLSEVQKRASTPGVPLLTKWFKNPKIAPERRALYLLMCYRKLQATEAAWLKQELFSSELSPSSAFLGPMAVAYVHLNGSKALKEIAGHFYKPNLPASRVTPLNRALTLAAEQTSNPKLKNAIVAHFRKELSHTQRGAFVLAPLALWGDEAEAAAAESLFSQNKNVTWVKVAVIRYFRTLSSDESKQAIKRLAKLDQRLVERTTDGYRRADLGID